MWKELGNFILQPSTLIIGIFMACIGLVLLLLPFSYALPLSWTVSLALIAIMLFVLYILHLYTDSQFNPEGSDFVYARKNNIPLLMVEAHNGVGRWVRGTKEKAGDIFFAFNHDSNEGIRIDPAVQSGATPVTTMDKGLRIYHYGTGSPFPVSSKQACAYDEIIKHVRANYPILSVFDAETILEYLARSRAELPDDCRNLASRQNLDIIIPDAELKRFEKDIEAHVSADYEAKGITEDMKPEIERLYAANVKDFVTEYRANYLVRTFMKIQDETSRLQLPMGKLFSYAEAFINNPGAYTAFDYQTLMQLFEMIARAEKMYDLKWIVGVCIGVGILLIMAALANSFSPG